MENALTVPQETKTQVLTAQQEANSLKVTTPDEAERGSELLRAIKDYSKSLTERKETMTRPLMQSLAAVRDLFKPHELDLKDAEKTVKAKLLAYQVEEQARVDAEVAKVLKKVEGGRMRDDTAAEKLGSIGEVKTIRGTQLRKVTKIRVVDETAIPREYLTPDMVKITEAVLRQNVDVPGVEKYEEQSLASV